MSHAYHHERFEFFVVVVVIAIIVIAVLGRYSIMADDAKILRMEVLSNHFMTGAANTRVQYFMASAANKNGSSRAFQFLGKTIYFSADGWPASISEPIGNTYQLTDEDCYIFWQLFLQNPAPITKGEFGGKNDYRSFAQENRCRYETADFVAHFDYYPIDGRLVFYANTALQP